MIEIEIIPPAAESVEGYYSDLDCREIWYFKNKKDAHCVHNFYSKMINAEERFNSMSCNDNFVWKKLPDNTHEHIKYTLENGVIKSEYNPPAETQAGIYKQKNGEFILIVDTDGMTVINLNKKSGKLVKSSNGIDFIADGWEKLPAGTTLKITIG